jgi:hypothetical protein
MDESAATVMGLIWRAPALSEKQVLRLRIAIDKADRDGALGMTRLN